MVTICLTCGDQGFPEALVYCSQCNISSQHRYCIDTSEVFFVEDITWSCEECDPHTSVPAQSCTSLAALSHSDKLEIDIKHQVTELEKEHIGETDQKRQPHTDDTEQKKSDICNSDKFDLNVPDSGISNQPGESQCSTIAVQNKKFEDNQLVLRGRVNSDEAESGELVEPMTSCTMEGVSQTESKPIVDPVWRGHLLFCNKTIGNFSGLAAHLSSLACEKVLEEAMLLPEVIRAEILPRSAVWPKSFEQCGPNSWSIALYFFPEGRSAEKAFDTLVNDVICQDMAMRVLAESAELLIFASNTLPVQYWRFKSKFYLWGVFRQKSPQAKQYTVPREKLDLSKPSGWETSSPISILSTDNSFSSNAFQQYGA